MSLHIVNSVCVDNAPLERCIKHLQVNDIIVLINSPDAPLKRCLDAIEIAISWYTLGHKEASDILSQIASHHSLSYDDYITLCAEQPLIQHWY